MKLDFLEHFLAFDHCAGERIEEYLKSEFKVIGIPYLTSLNFEYPKKQKKINHYKTECLEFIHTREVDFLKKCQHYNETEIERENTILFFGDNKVASEIILNFENLLRQDYKIRHEVSPINAQIDDIEFRINMLAKRYL